MNRFWTLHLVLNDHLYKYTAETRFYDRRFNDIRDGTVSTDFCVQVKVTVNRLYHGFFDAILTSRQPRGKLPCLYDNLMSKNFRKKTILNKKTDMNCKLKLHSKKFYYQTLGAVTVLKFLKTVALDFPYQLSAIFSSKFLLASVKK